MVHVKIVIQVAHYVSVMLQFARSVRIVFTLRTRLVLTVWMVARSVQMGVLVILVEQLMILSSKMISVDVLMVNMMSRIIVLIVLMDVSIVMLLLVVMFVGQQRAIKNKMNFVFVMIASSPMLVPVLLARRAASPVIMISSVPNVTLKTILWVMM
jgi:hypothetical protein